MSAKNSLGLENEATKSPGGVYLCQVGERVFCGACCGLYNIVDFSQGSLETILNGRTEDFARVPRMAEAIEAFQKKSRAGHSLKGRFQTDRAKIEV